MMLSLGLLFNWPYCCSATQQSDKWWTLLTLNARHDRWNYYVEPQLRLIYQNGPFQQFLNNVGAGYEFMPEWQFWLGETTSADSQDAVAKDQAEIRLWEQLLWTHRFNKLSLTSRSRLENRYSLNFPEWAFRFRERLMLSHPIKGPLSWLVYDELFYNLNTVPWIVTAPFDQNRAFIGVAQQLTSILLFSTGYLNQYISTQNRQFNHVFVLWFTVNLDA